MSTVSSSFHFSPNSAQPSSFAPSHSSPTLSPGTVPTDILPSSAPGDASRFSPQLLDPPSPSSLDSDVPTPLFERPPSSQDSSSTRPVPPTRSVSFKSDGIWGTTPSSTSPTDGLSRGLGNGDSSSLTFQRTTRAASDGLLLTSAFGGGLSSVGEGGGRGAVAAGSRLSSLSSSGEDSGSNGAEEQALFREHQRRSLEHSASQGLTSSKGFVSSPPLAPAPSLAANRGVTSPFFQPPSFLSTSNLTNGNGNSLPSLLSPTAHSPPQTGASSFASQQQPNGQFGGGAEYPGGPPGSRGATLHLGDLDVWMDEAYVRECCTMMGWDNVVNVKMSRGASSPTSGYCFLTFSSTAEAAKVLQRFNAAPPLLMPRSGRTFKLNWGTGLPGLQPRWDGEFSVFVGDLAREVGEAELMALFTPLFPSTKSAKVMCDPSTGLSRGYGFVRFTEEPDMQRALLLGANPASGLLLHGRTIRISEASGPGVGGGPNGSPLSAIDGQGHGHLRERTRTRSSGGGGGGGAEYYQQALGQQQQQPPPHLLQQHQQQQQQLQQPQPGYFPPYPSHPHPPPSSQYNGGDPAYADPHHNAYASPPLKGGGYPGMNGGGGPFSPYGPPSSTMSPLNQPLNGRPSLGMPLSPGLAGPAGRDGGAGVGGEARTPVRQIPQGQVPPGGDPNNTTVFVGGLPACISEETLKSFFHHFGEITYCKIPAGKGCGFVQFVRRQDAELAIAKMNDFPIHGKSRIRLSWGRSQGDKQVEHVRKLASALGVPFDAVWRMVQGQDNSTIKQIATAVGTTGTTGGSGSQAVAAAAAQAPTSGASTPAGASSPPSTAASRMDLRAVATAAGLTEAEVLDLVRAGAANGASTPSTANGASSYGGATSASSGIASDFFRNAALAANVDTTSGATSPQPNGDRAPPSSSSAHLSANSNGNGIGANPYSRVSPSSFSSAFAAQSGQLPLSPPPSAGPGNPSSFAQHQQFPPAVPFPSYSPSHSHQGPSPYNQIRPDSYTLQHSAQSPYERVDFADGGRPGGHAAGGGAGGGGGGFPHDRYQSQSFAGAAQGPPKYHGYDGAPLDSDYTTSPPPLEDGFANLSLHQQQQQAYGQPPYNPYAHQQQQQPRSIPPPHRHGRSQHQPQQQQHQAQAPEFFPAAVGSPRGANAELVSTSVGNGSGSGGEGGWSSWNGA